MLICNCAFFHLSSPLSRQSFKKVFIISFAQPQTENNVFERIHSLCVYQEVNLIKRPEEPCPCKLVTVQVRELAAEWLAISLNRRSVILHYVLCDTV